MFFVCFFYSKQTIFGLQGSAEHNLASLANNKVHLLFTLKADSWLSVTEC